LIKAVIFDLGAVVVDFTNQDYYAQLAKKTGLKFRTVEKTFDGMELDLMEKGRMKLGTFEKKMAEKLNIKGIGLGWCDFFVENAKINFDVQELVGMLHKEYITAFISNVDKSRYIYTRKMINLDFFDYKFASCYIGSRKPERKIYDFAIKRMGIAYENAVFIDDLQENVDGAKKLGIKAIRFENRRKLDKELYKLGL
jgi:putative hydrolase of the HAD superfamily